MLPSFIRFTEGESRNNHHVIDTSNKLDEEELIKKAIQVELPPETRTVTDESCSVVSSISELDVASSFRAHSWDKKTFFSDFVRKSLRSLGREDDDVVMLFQNPESDSLRVNFSLEAMLSQSLGPCRYSLMNGTSFPTYFHTGEAPADLMEHWLATIPGFHQPTFTNVIPERSLIYAYLPCEALGRQHLNDPSTHYHLAGKDALPLMSDKTTKMLPNTKDVRPCVAKVVHSMASKGVFVIRNDEDEAAWLDYWQSTGSPQFVVTEYVDVARNVACHFFVHPSGNVTFIGSNENHKREDGTYSMDSYLIGDDQEYLKEIQLPFVKDVAQYCNSLGFWGFCGVDVLFDVTGKGYLVDVNPRVTGSCPSLMALQLLQDEYGFDFGLFRRNGPNCYHGSAKQLFQAVQEYNEKHEGHSRVVLFSVSEKSSEVTKVNIGVYSHSIATCEQVLNEFARSEEDSPL